MTLSVGSYSHGTLLNEDIAATLRDMLLSQEHTTEDRMVVELDAIASDEGRDEEHDSDVISDAMDILQDYAPVFCYVGMHEGDGSDLGVWFSSEAFEDACNSGEVLKISDSSELEDMAKEDLASYSYFAVISDHGNISLFNVQVTLGAEIFSIV
jgi:hypothetical protein